MISIRPRRGFRRLFPFLVLACGLSLPLAHAAPAAGAAPPRVDLRALKTAKSFDRFIVKFRAGSAPANSPAALAMALDRAAARGKQALQASQRARGVEPAVQDWSLHPQRRLAVGADLFTASRKLDHAQVRQLLTQLGADPDVEYVEIDQVLHEALVPNDTSYLQLWGLQDADAGIRADKAWDLGTGSGVVVAVIDTGYADHSDLNGNILPGYDFIADPARANDGDGRDADAHDPGNWGPGKNSNWHGTHVAGTIGALANNAKGVAGAAFNARIVPVRVLGVDGGDGADIADAIVWASGGAVPGAPANANPAEVLNLSLGGSGGCSATYQAAIDGAVGRGSLVVVSAGNDSRDAGGGSLATCNNVLVVGAHTSASARSSFSNYGAVVDVTGPGSSILSTLNSGTTMPAAESYATYQGTSMSAPHASAAAALTQGYRVARGFAPYSPAQLEAQLKATSYPMAQSCIGASGAGIVDARTLLDTAGGAFKLLSDGVAQSNQSAAAGASLRYAMVSSKLAQGLSFSTAGGSGNADLYVKFGSEPTTSVYDCRSNAAGNTEACTIPSAQAGTWYVLVRASSAFSGLSVTGSLAGNRQPLVNFGTATASLTANFTDTSSDPDGSIASRSWSFGDGSSSTQVNPSHAYAIAGAYSVQLTATDSSGGSNCSLKQVTVNPATVALSNGVTVNNIAANVGAQLRYTLAVPAGASNLVFTTANGSGDADLYVKFGSPPGLDDFDCVSGSPTNAESCAIPAAQSGTWHVMVHAYSSISGVSLTGSYSGVGGNAAPTANFNVSTSGLTANFTDASSDSDGSIASRNWSFGDGTTSTATNPSHTYGSAGTYNVTLTVTDNGGLSHAVTKAVTVASPGGGVTVSIADVVLDEGNATARTMTFKVQLSAAATGPVKYNIATANGSATAGSDYTAKSLTGVSIATGVLSKNFAVSIKGDTVQEADENFTVTLSNVTGASVADGQATGTIRNDDAASSPMLSVGNVALAEGNSGTKLFTFTVSLSQLAAGNVSYNIATANATATAGSDYVASSLSGQVIPAGQLSKTFSVTVNGDTALENSERFRVDLSGVSGAGVADAQGIATIRNDD